MRYSTSRQVAGSSPDEVIKFFFLIYLILPAALGSKIYSTSNWNEYQNIFLDKTLPASNADILTAIFESKCEILDIS
jgi:hypothetical protein